MSSSDRQVLPSSASVTVQSQESGVLASIVGGHTRTFGISDQVILDASTSLDLDYPTNSQPNLLSYQWTCVQVYPNYGEPCFNFLSQTTSTYSASASNLLGSSSVKVVYTMTVVVVNAVGQSAIASVTVQITNIVVPSVSIGSVNPKYNVGDIITIAGSIQTSSPVQAVWSSNDVNLVSIALTPITATIFNTGQSSFPLAIASASSLSPRKTYTLQLTATYLNSNISSYSQVSIVMRSPPSGGAISTFPTVGYALTTNFLIQTSKCKF